MIRRLAGGLAAAVLLATATDALAETATLSNNGYIAINDKQSQASSDPPGKSVPYPSAIDVSGLSGSVSAARVQLQGLTHPYMAQLGVALMGPNGAGVMLMSGVPGRNISGATPTFDDAAPTTAGCNGVWYQFNLRFKPTYCGGPRAFPAPGPPATGLALAAFNGISPNGTWSLYAIDNVKGDTGYISGGWILTLDYSPAAAPQAGGGGAVSPGSVGLLLGRRGRSVRVSRSGVFTLAFLGTPGAKGRARFTTAQRVVVPSAARRARLKLATKRFIVPASAKVRLRVKLRRTVRRLLLRRKRLKVRAAITLRGGQGVQTARDSFTLRAPSR